ncbi:tRNA pseudouridine(55) synthase [Mycoplasma enhydrae]|uniref:tRNA pseudouridine(55) synthase n=1 Tax=Mycoplasma enhydrae TaxID=2499220 RepID=UPI0021E75CBB|nr:tRNA pseudouridine(55) synthase [Mycoplasma enhydrae]MCV3733850.1 tRNA pseudouridine(55) synthase [Mycoplasma enhydrae]
MFYKINKPRGISSFLAIKKFAKENNIKKIGHSGTLDPLAEGLLIVASDDDTKVLSHLIADTKVYYVEASLHYISASYDEGQEVFYLDNKPKIKKQELLEVLNKIKNTKSQIPPAFSAKKINGKRSYELARENIFKELLPCQIEIYSLDLIGFDYENQKFIIETKVSKGTYIRSLVHDIGLVLNTDAIVNVLKRKAIGNIKLDFQNFYEPIANLEDLFSVKLYTLNKDEIEHIKNKQLFLNRLIDVNDWCMFTYNNEIIGWGKIKNGEIVFDKIIGNRVFSNPNTLKGVSNE